MIVGSGVSRSGSLINLLQITFIIAFTRAVIFKRGGLAKRQFLCDMHNLMSAGFLMYLFMNDFSPGCLLAVVVI